MPKLFVIFFIWCAFLFNMMLEDYRAAAFNTLARDDYAPYVMHLAGMPDGAIPNSPFRERIGSVALAAPLLKIIPALKFSQLPDTTSAPYLKATLTLTLLNYTLYALAILILGYVAIGKHPAHWASWLLLSLPGIQILEGTGVDGIGCALVAGMVALHRSEKLLWLGIAGVISILFNEKSTLFFLGFVGGLWLLKRSTAHTLLCAAGLLTLLAYIVIRSQLGGGNDHQLMPSAYPAAILHTLLSFVSPRGILLCLLPLLLVLSCAYAGRVNTSLLIPAIGGAALLVLASAAANVEYNVGRILMYSWPVWMLLAMAPVLPKQVK